MFKKIMTPVDLSLQDTLGRALKVAADIAAMQGIEVCYVGVTMETPGALGRTSAEYEEKLKAFAAEQAELHGHKASHRMMIARDLTTEVDDALIRAVKETGADLVVMSTHKPGIGDYLWPSNGGKLAARSDASVFLVRAKDE